MIEEQIIEYETAKLAKEKGFIGVVGMIGGNNYYNHKGELNGDVIDSLIPKNRGKEEFKSIAAPRQSLLQRWLRETHNIHVQPQKHFHDKGYKIGKIPVSEVSYNGPHNKKYDSYEQALEQGLLEALNLI